MVKIRNVYGDEYKGKQGNAVYQKRYGKQIRRIRETKKRNKAPGQVEQQRRFKVGLSWYKGLSTVEKQGLKDWIKQNGINLTAQQYAIKTALDRGRATKEIWSEQTKDWAYMGGWDAEGWLYRQKITISNSNSYDLTDFQVRLELNSTNVGANFDWSRGGADLRFYDENGTKLSYYVESWDEVNKTAVVWVKVPLIQAGGSTSVKMYYGNSSAASESNAKEVFDWYDDVNTFDISNYDIYDADVTKDTENGYVSIKSINEGYGIIAKGLTVTDAILEGELQILNWNGDQWGGLLARWQNEGNCYGLQCKIDTSGENPVIEKWVNGSRSQACGRGSGIGASDWVVYRFTLHGNTLERWDSKSGTTCSVTWTDFNEGRVGVGCGGTGGGQNGETRFKWWRVRKYANIEPSATFQAEEYGLTYATVIIQVEHVIIQHAGMQNVYLLDENDTVIKSYENLSDLASAELCTSVEYRNDTQKNIRKVIIESVSGVLNSIYL